MGIVRTWDSNRGNDIESQNRTDFSFKNITFQVKVMNIEIYFRVSITNSLMYYYFFLNFLQVFKTLKPNSTETNSPINKNIHRSRYDKSEILILLQTLKNPKSFVQTIFHYLTNNNIRNVTHVLIPKINDKEK